MKFPGLVNSWGYPIKIRMDMISTGIRTPVGVKVSGDDLKTIERVAMHRRRGQPTFPARARPSRIASSAGAISKSARTGANWPGAASTWATFQGVIQTALGGMKLAESVQGRERYNIMLRYDRPFRETPEQLGEVLVPTPEGQHIPLAELAASRSPMARR